MDPRQIQTLAGLTAGKITQHQQHANVDLQEIHDFLCTLARTAGQVILAARPTAARTGSKVNSADLVTETDKAVEKMVGETIREKYPGFEFMGEETYKPGDVLTASPTFIVDPIDGTTNFVHTYPYACISLGFAIDRDPAVGVIFNPFTEQLFTGIKGRGSWLTSPFHDKEKLPLRDPEPFVSSSSNDNGTTDVLTKCLIITEWGYDRSGNDYDVKVNTFRRLCADKKDGGAMVHSIRSLGSAALNMCSVAAGWADIYWEAGGWAWDVCAAWVVVKEAGGEIVDANPGGWKPAIDGRRFLVVRGGDGWEMAVKEFWGYIEGELEVGN
ncbi:Inositol-1-monophosphatase [Dactylellina cionopaga]|nr:Inositol-1-monophosphatase [Dactylellina cionopaga]